MARIRAVGTCLPPHILHQDEVKTFASNLFAGSFRNIERLLPIFQNGKVKTRHFCMPLDWYGQPHSFAEKNERYREWAVKLGTAAAADCLNKADRSIKDIDHLFFVSTSGISTPSIDALIMNELKAGVHTKRTPIWGLGCAGGCVGISRAFEYVKAYPEQRALLIAVECCGLTFQQEDRSKSNLVATSLFADGAAAVLIEGEQCLPEGHGPRIEQTLSTLWPDTRDIMGWEVNDAGLKVIFSRDIPTFVHSMFKPNVYEFLEQHHLRTSDITHFITHPGGYKVIEAYAEVFGVPLDRFSAALDVLQKYGNMSSVTVLFVLNEILSNGIQPGEYGILTALGPGFSSELLLVKR
ncbi:3-oxoacyl-[acyl-carrier-protein] synthase III C-terminal domain-containing protein [Aneurinibacillus sp. Ricciae_BoGa-3]|uniref:type III polyketide synthase n=1 Tax=Aneurinibacillus sp. Ricciae_BoGa-3 TaxID=3022697 RepID=UPI002340C6F8|nr:3-oxoacyl-[acyl-carrier-protein] synthase III C-terminal domain-containing protein [Aneurinibacillus sp. Ricciae_BoGa-3]WCK52441.1 3-oxoacyl-[acyl-carrier-protein] synthase III C-terminal domain-containing protein [Aneurinibacillus sp. Ricciae_BoGa-3]